MQRKRNARPTESMVRMARAIYYMPGGVTRDEQALARRAGTTQSGATRTLRSMADRGLATRSIHNWSLTTAGTGLLDDN
jgi:DNA-binding MarR family transcriptional regulator